jgi:hypothetical protein
LAQRAFAHGGVKMNPIVEVFGRKSPADLKNESIAQQNCFQNLYKLAFKLG